MDVDIRDGALSPFDDADREKHRESPHTITIKPMHGSHGNTGLFLSGRPGGETSGVITATDSGDGSLVRTWLEHAEASDVESPIVVFQAKGADQSRTVDATYRLPEVITGWAQVIRDQAEPRAYYGSEWQVHGNENVEDAVVIAEKQLVPVLGHAMQMIGNTLTGVVAADLRGWDAAFRLHAESSRLYDTALDRPQQLIRFRAINSQEFFPDETFELIFDQSPELAIGGLVRVRCRARSIVWEAGQSWVKEAILGQRGGAAYITQRRRAEGQPAHPRDVIGGYVASEEFIAETIDRVAQIYIGDEVEDLHAARIGSLEA